MTNGKPTIKKIAKLANVSIGTVDRVIHSRGDVSKTTRDRVKQIMADLDYVPNTFARNLVLNKIFNIAVLIPEHKEGEYWSAPLQGAKKAQTEFNSLGVKINIYYYNQYLKESFLSVTKQLLTDQNDAVLLARVLFKETNAFLEKCNQQRIPFVLIGVSQKDTNAISHIGQDSYQSGRLAAELLSMGQIRDSAFLILNMTKAKNPNYNVTHRIKGFKNFFKNYKKESTLYDYNIPQEDNDLIKKITKKIQSFGKLDGIFIPNSKAYMMADTLVNKENVRIVGYDILANNKLHMERGIIDVLINQRSDEQVFQGIEYLYKYLALNQAPPAIVSLPLDIVTREKLMYY